VTNEKRKSPMLERTNTGLEIFSLLSHRKKPIGTQHFRTNRMSR
jgi:hypothetical protein